ERYWWYRSKSVLMKALLDDYLPSVKNSKHSGSNPIDRLKVIDLGCGTGSMFGVLAPKGSLYGLEPSRDAIAFAVTQKKALLVRAESCAIPFKDRSFDVAAIFDSLEHVDDDLSALKETHRILHNKGLLLVSVPAYPWLITWREKQLGHKRRYSKKSLTSVLTQAGFQISFLRYMFAALFPLMVVKAIKDKLLPAPNVLRSDIAMPPEPWNTLLTKWFNMEANISKKVGLPFGTSLVCVAHPLSKPADDVGKKDAQ
ncbi:MAG: class I SAM-dependent methyltransferase, partial [bacterium]